jgi:hypothetical protein
LTYRQRLQRPRPEDHRQADRVTVPARPTTIIFMVALSSWVNNKAERIGNQGRVTMAKPKQDQYMSEEKAIQKGYRPANGAGEWLYGIQPQTDLSPQRRTIQCGSGNENHVSVTFDDKSTLKLRIAGQVTVSVGAKVEAVHEAGEHFQVDFEEGPSVQVQLADPGSSVELRDKSGAVHSSVSTTS